MATYIQGVTDQIPVIQPYQPDFNMMQKVLSTLQAKYDQGFASVNNAYNQLLHAPITNDILKQERDAYAKTAELKLKDLASVDLSIQQNQVEAENVFAPFWNDGRILTDMYHTRNIQNEMIKGFEARDSKDEKVRAQYNDMSIRYLQNGLEELKTTNPDSPEFGKLQTRRWVPFKNLEDYLNEQAKAQGLKIEWESPTGPYLVKMQNGEKAIRSFKTWAHNMIGNNFVEQFNVMGTVETEDYVRNILRNNPSLTKQQALGMLADGTLNNVVKGYDRQIEDYNKDLTEIRTRLDLYRNSKTPLSEEQEANFKELLGQEDVLDKTIGETIQNKSAYLRDYDKKKSDFLIAPTNYFATINKQRVVEGWATAYATGNQARSVEFNPAVKEANENKWKELDYLLKEKEYNLEVWKARNPIKTRSKSSGSGGDGTAYDEEVMDDPALGGQYLGKGITDVTKVGDAYELLMQRLNNKWITAHKNFFDPGGMGLVLEKNISIDGKKNMSRSDTTRFLTLMENWTADPENFRFGDDYEWFISVKDKLSEKSGIKITGPGTARNALIALTGDYIKTKRSVVGIDDDDIRIFNSYRDGVRALEDYTSINKQRDQEVQNIINREPEKYKTILKKNSDGKNDIATVDDAVKDFKPMVALNPDNKEIKISARDFAAAYLSGNFQYHGSGDFSLNGTFYRLTDFEGKSTKWYGTDHIQRFADFLYSREDDILRPKNPNAIESKYGTSQQQKDLRGQLNTSVVARMPEYESETGRYGAVMRYNFSKNKTKDGKPEYGIRLMNEASNADNRLAIYTGSPGGRMEQSKNDDLNAAIINLMKLGDGSAEDYISGVELVTVGQTGNPMLRLIFNPVKTTDQTKVGDEDLTKLAGKDVMIELNPRASGEYLSNIKYGSGYYIYDNLLRGKSMISDDVMESAGFHYEIVPNNTKNPTYAHVEIQRTVFDPKLGKEVVMPKIKEDFYFSRTNPDELKDLIDDLLRRHILEYQAAQYEYTKSQAANPNRRLTAQEIEERYKSTKHP